MNIDALGQREVVWLLQFLLTFSSIDCAVRARRSNCGQLGGVRSRISIWHYRSEFRRRFVVKKPVKGGFCVEPRIGLPIISTCLPFVALLFPSCLSDLSDVVPHLPPSCLALVLQIWSFPRLRVSSRCAFPILSQLFSTLPHNAQLSSRFSHPIISHSFSLAFQIVSELPPRCGLPVVS